MAGTKKKEEWYTNDLMVTAAHRYCLGRATYIVSDCVSWLLRWWDTFQPHTRKQIIRETKEAIEADCAGDNCDVEEWKKLLEIVGEK